MSRPPIAERDVERIRRERYAPRRTQWDYLHLADLRRALDDVFQRIALPHGPTLDLYCGTQPYRAMIPRPPVWGVDIDRHFARADVVADLPLPFGDATFALAVCTQALHLVRDPAATTRELRRVVAPGGYAVITVPHVFRREIPAERKLTAAALQELFAGWDADVRGVGGLGSAFALYPAGFVANAARRWPAIRPILAPAGLGVTVVGAALNVILRPLARRWPACWVVVARRPAR